MRNGKKTGAAALLLCGVMAASAVGMGFAKWQTTVTAGGNVSAAGKWDVEMTDASVTLSSGAQLRENDADYGLQNVCAQKVYGQACIEAAVPRTKLTSFPVTGTQNSRFAVSSWLWLVDTTRFDLSRLGTIGIKFIINNYRHRNIIITNSTNNKFCFLFCFCRTYCLRINVHTNFYPCRCCPLNILLIV